MGGLIEGELRKLKQHRGIKDPKEMEQYIPEAIARAATKSAMSSKFTQRRWDAAEDHLRMALKTAVENPRGESVAPLAFIPICKGGRTSTGLTLPKKDRTLSKKERKIAEKERKREKRRANEGGKSMAVQGFAGRVSTLSAATAAQNLAVILKQRSDWVRLSLLDDNDEVQQGSSNQLDQIIDEARHLYEAALHVRKQILPPHHPEVVASKFSLAELLDSTDPTSLTFGSSKGRAIDSDRANWLREAILESYDIEERD